MVIIFFRETIREVQNLIDRNKDNSCAFWYAPGLSSYKYLHEVITITSLYIEERIFDNFKKDYPYLIKHYTYELFKSVESDATLELNKQKSICFLASNDTIVKSFKPIIDNMNQQDIKYSIYCRKNESAFEAGKSLGLPIKAIKFNIPTIEEHSLLVLGNDWGLLEQKINYDFLQNKINTVCIQESSIDFNPIDQRMMYCSFPIYQGVATLLNIDILNKICAVIGNPRFEKLKPAPLPIYNKALVNVNFTYNIYEDIRDSWVKDIVDTCNDLQLDYILSQHPRDKGVFPDYKVQKSNALLVHDSIRDSSVLISRFSALLTEAICLGRPAIYYNPHGENMHYNFEPYNKMFFYATNIYELRSALDYIISGQKESEDIIENYIQKHIGNAIEEQSSKYISLILNDISKYPLLRKSNFKNVLKTKLKMLKRKILKQSY